MQRNDIQTLSYVEGHRISALLGAVFAYADTYDGMIEKIVDQGNERAAELGIDFKVTISGIFYGQGTAIRVEKI